MARQIHREQEARYRRLRKLQPFPSLPGRPGQPRRHDYVTAADRLSQRPSAAFAGGCRG